MKTYRRLLSFARPFHTFLPWFLLFSIISTIFSTLNFTFFAPILDVLFGKDKQHLKAVTWEQMPTFSLSSEYFGQLKDWGLAYLMADKPPIDILLNVCLLLIATVFIANLFQFLSGYSIASLKGRIVRGIRVTVYEKILQLHLSYFSDEHRGDIISRMTNDVQEIETTLISSINVLMRQPITIFITFFVLFKISASLTLFSLLVLPVSAVIIAIITKQLRGKAKQGQHFLGTILSNIDETLSGLKVIQSFTAEEYVGKRFDKENRAYEKVLRAIDVNYSLASPISQFFGILVVVLIMYYGGKLIFEGGGDLDAGMFMVFIILFASVITPIKSLSNAFGTIQRGIVAGERLFAILDKEVKIESPENAKILTEFKDKIVFENVQFKYDETPILKGINLEIKKGQTIALVGPSGGGKSTMIDLLPRFHDVAAGKILVDGSPIQEYELKSLRNQLGIVTQKPILFHDTVYNNITFGMEVTKEQVIEAAKIANAHDFILKLDNGYDTVVGDGGGKLSGGQQQRVTIARAVLKNPAIFLLDEATSALDTESEHLIQDAFDNIMKGRTSVVIAHRLSTIRNADKIVVIKEGEIVEEGTHDELIQNEEGLYRKLVMMQNS